MDLTDASEMTYLRFGYFFTVPAGATYSGNGWKYYANADKVFSLEASNNLLYEDGVSMSNLVIPKVLNTQYQKKVYAKAHLTYTTVDGTEVTAEEATAHDYSVKDVATKIKSNSMATKADREYAEKILAACTD